MNWRRRVKQSDLIFVRGKYWKTSPIFYYLKGDRYQFVGKDFAQAVQKRPDADVWVITWRGDEIEPDMIDSLRGYRPTEDVKVFGRAVCCRPEPAGQRGDLP